jgi:hypothetical protein
MDHFFAMRVSAPLLAPSVRVAGIALLVLLLHVSSTVGNLSVDNLVRIRTVLCHVCAGMDEKSG